MAECGAAFSKIWEVTSYHEDVLFFFALASGEGVNSVVKHSVEFLRRLPCFPRGYQKMVDSRDRFIGSLDKPAFIMNKMFDGQVFLLTATAEFLPLVQSVLQLFEVETRVDSAEIARELPRLAT